MKGIQLYCVVILKELSGAKLTDNVSPFLIWLLFVHILGNVIMRLDPTVFTFRTPKFNSICP
jgi:hypothetical protein